MKPLSPGVPSEDQSRESVTSAARLDERRAVEIKGYIIRSDKSIVDVKLVDLSYNGCSVSTLVPLVAGEKLKLSALGRGATAATVRWYKDRKAGLLFQSEPISRQRWPRKAERLQVKAGISIRRTGRLSFRVHTFDLSRFGCSCEFIERPSMYETVWAKFDRLESIQSIVVWVEESRIGLMFKNAIHPAVFEMLFTQNHSELAYGLEAQETISPNRE